MRDDRSVRAVVLTGAGKAFCVGADLSAMRAPEAGETLGDQTAKWMQSVSNPLIEEMRALPVPVVCAVNGAAAGAGVGLALAGDVTLAAQERLLLPAPSCPSSASCRTWAAPGSSRGWSARRARWA